MPYLLSLLFTFLRTIGVWLLRLFWNQLVLWFGMTIAAWVIAHYGDAIKEALIHFNASIRDTVFQAQTYITELADAISEKVKTLIASWKARVEAILADLENVAVSDFGLSEWFAGFRERLARKVGTIVHELTFAALAPARSVVEGLILSFSHVLEDLEEVESQIHDAVEGMYDRFWNEIMAAVEAFNGRVADVVATANGLADVLNGNIEEIRGHVEEQISAMDAATMQAEWDASNLAAYLSAHCPDGPLSSAEASDLADDAVAHVTAADVNDLLSAIDFDAYRIEAPDLSGLELDIDMPTPEDLPAFGMEELIAAIDALCSDLSELTGPLDGLAQHIMDGLRDALPDWIDQDASTGIKVLLGAAAVEALLAKRDEILEVVDQFRDDMATARTETGTAIAEKTQAVKDGIRDMERTTIETLPDILQPATDEYKRELEDQIVEMEEVVLVNIDKIAPPGEVDHILDSFPADVTAGSGPSLSDSERFSIGDIYRILCGYFSRGERIALLTMIARMDVQKNLEEIIDLPAPAPTAGE